MHCGTIKFEFDLVQIKPHRIANYFEIFYLNVFSQVFILQNFDIKFLASFLKKNWQQKNGADDPQSCGCRKVIRFLYQWVQRIRSRFYYIFFLLWVSGNFPQIENCIEQTWDFPYRVWTKCGYALVQIFKSNAFSMANGKILTAQCHCCK